MKSEPKPRKLSNKQLMESALSYIAELGYTTTDIEMGDTYFMFQGNNNSICHFHIKEIPDFIFAFWSVDRFDSIEYSRKHNIPSYAEYYNISDKTELVFFTQYEPDLDKFKPSRSGFLTGIYRQAWLEKKNDEKKTHKVEEWQAYDLENILKYMKKHKYKSRIYVQAQIDKIYDDIGNIKTITTILRDDYYRNKYKRLHKKEKRKSLKKLLQIAKKLKTYEAYITECNYMSPRYELKVKAKLCETEEDLLRHYKEEDYLESCENLQFDKKYLKEMCIEELGIDPNYAHTDYEGWSENDFKIAKSRGKQFYSIYKNHMNDKTGDFKILYSNLKGDE